MRSVLSSLVLSAAFSVVLPAVSVSAQNAAGPRAPVAPSAAPATTRPADALGKPITVELTLQEQGLSLDRLRASRMGYMPATFRLVDDKPAAITKEPAYQGKPLYGAVRLGNGPRNITYLVVDEAPGKVGKLYADLNQNGDLTDDGPGDWGQVREVDGVRNYMTTLTPRASWGSPVKEDDGGNYALLMYKRDGDRGGGYAKLAGRAGKLPLGDNTYDIVLAENTNDAIFTVPATGDTGRRMVEVYIDLDGDGTFKGLTRTVDGKEMRFPERFNITDPIEVEGQRFLVRPSYSGAKITFTPVAAPAGNTPTPAAQVPVEVIKAPLPGTVAPDFTVQKPDGSPVKLSDYRGKIVVIDFWATWCGPCIAAMPGLQRVYDSVKDQDVVVFSVNVFDTKTPFDAWVAKHSGTKYTFDFAFDPAGRGKDSVASGKYGVTGIPTMYVIDRDGKVAASLVGSGNEEKLVKALSALGVKTPAH